MTRHLLWLCGCLLVACGARLVEPPSFPLPGTYTLCSIGGQKLPYQVTAANDPNVVLVVADTLTMLAGGQFSIRQHRTRKGVPQGTNTDYQPSDGTWSSSDSIRLRDMTPQFTEWFRGTFDSSAGRLSLRGNAGFPKDPFVWVYQQIGTPCP